MRKSAWSTVQEESVLATCKGYDDLYCTVVEQYTLH